MREKEKQNIDNKKALNDSREQKYSNIKPSDKAKTQMKLNEETKQEQRQIQPEKLQKYEKTYEKAAQ